MSDIFDTVMDVGTGRRAGLGEAERRQPVRRATGTALGPDLWELELHPVRALEALAPDIARVATEAVEPNIFFTLPLLRAAYPRLARMRARPLGSVHFLCLYLTRPDGDRHDARRLVLFMPLAVPRLGWPGRATAMAASSEFTPVGTPLVAGDVLDEAVERCLALLGHPDMTLPPLLTLPDGREDGPVAQAFARAASRLGLPVAALQHRKRALHEAGGGLRLSRKRMRDHERQLRRLQDAGRVTFAEARAEGEVLDAFEAFVALELKSWKGRRGSALYNRKLITAFSRQAVVSLAREDACSVHSLALDGRTIASLIVLGDERTGLVTWKTAYDPAHHAASPGVQVLLAATRAVDARYPNGLSVDSLAVENHPVMDRVWAGRGRLATTIIGLSGSAGPQVAALTRAIERRDRWRARARHWLDTLGRLRRLR